MIRDWPTEEQARAELRQVLGLKEARIELEESPYSAPELRVYLPEGCSEIEHLVALGWKDLPGSRRRNTPVEHRLFRPVRVLRGRESFVRHLASLRDGLEEALSENNAHAATKATEIGHRLRNTFTGWFGESHRYVSELAALFEAMSREVRPGRPHRELLAYLRALIEDLDAGFDLTHADQVRVQTYTGMLALAERVLNEQDGGPLPAAVIAGVVLESHLMQLCQNRGLTRAADKGGIEALGNALASIPASPLTPYDRADIRSWQLLRNAAAHGDAAKLDSERVPDLIRGVARLLARVPA